MKLKGKYSVTLLRDGKIIRKEEGHNLITDEGANAALATLFVNGTQTDIWYVRLIQSGGMAASTDTAAQHSNWYEETHYTGDVEWVPNAPLARQFTAEHNPLLHSLMTYPFMDFSSPRQQKEQVPVLFGLWYSLPVTWTPKLVTLSKSNTV